MRSDTARVLYGSCDPGPVRFGEVDLFTQVGESDSVLHRGGESDGPCPGLRSLGGEVLHQRVYGGPVLTGEGAPESGFFQGTGTRPRSEAKPMVGPT